MIKTQRKKQILNKKDLLIPGNLLTLKITAVGANNVGINEFSYGMPVLVPNAKLDDTVRVKVLKVLTSKKIAIAKLVSSIKNTKIKPVKQENTNLPTLTVGTKLEITINKLGSNSTGIADLSNTFSNVNLLIVKKPLIQIGEKLIVTITRIKKAYAFALIDNFNTLNETHGLENKIQNKEATKYLAFKGTKFTIVLPKKAKRFLKHIVFKVAKRSQQKLTVNRFQTTTAESNWLKTNPSGEHQLSVSTHLFDVNTLPKDTILFVKPCLGAKLGTKVQIQITKFFKISGFLKYNVAIAKIIKLNPRSVIQKKALVRTSLRKMLKSSMHYGEKAIKCNARMKNFVWTRKKTIDGKQGKTLIPFIKKGRNVINLLKTRRCLNKALTQLTKHAAKGKTFLFVGTKKAASGLVSRAALFSKKAFFVNTRWLGGMLTNWKTILKSISKIRPILKEKQIIIKHILEKRQNIKTRLIQKALFLRKKSKFILKKGRLLIQKLKLNNSINFEKINNLSEKRKEIVSKGTLLLEKRLQLCLKRQELISQSQALKSKARTLTKIYLRLINNLMLSRKKLRELKALLIISKELQTFIRQAKQDNENIFMVSYNRFKTIDDIYLPQVKLIAPPKAILNKMISLIKRQFVIFNNNNLNLKSVNGNKTMILSQLLSKFHLFVPTIKVSIKNLQTYISAQKSSLNTVFGLLNTVKHKISFYLSLKNKLITELQKIKQLFMIERNIMRVLRRRFKQILAQKRFIKFLPKMRYLSTTVNTIEQTARFLLKKFVDPKMKYPMDNIYDEKSSRQSKKLASSRKKKWQRLEKYLGGISNMTKMQEKQIRNNVAIIIGQQEEMNAVRECQKLGIKMFHIVDTNCNPGFADHFIPANDDARNSIKFILGKFLTNIRLAQKLKLRLKNKKFNI